MTVYLCAKSEAETIANHPKVRPHLGGSGTLEIPDGVVLLRKDGAVGMFHTIFDGVWMGHHAIHPNMWGRAVEPMMNIIDHFRCEYRPARIIGWTPEDNRLAVNFAKKLGFSVDGVMPLPTGNLLMLGRS